MAASVVGTNAHLKVNPSDLTAKASQIQNKINEMEALTYYVKDLNDASAKYEDLESTITSNVKALDDPSNIFNV